MGKLTIIGSSKPVIGEKEMYSVSSLNDWDHLVHPLKNPLEVPKTHWEVMVKTQKGWRKGGSNKEGQTVPYTFGQKSLLYREIKIVAQQGEDKAELMVHPQRAKKSKITKVDLLDANYKPIPKGKKLSYKDTIIARAYCVEMFMMHVAFSLWEDDAPGAGHNPVINALNKINSVPVLGTVDEKGIAEAVFRLPAYIMAVQIANARIASGDQDEGATHEYYVTADVISRKIQKASANVNVDNATYTEAPPRQRKLLAGQTLPLPKPVPVKPKPKEETAKFPQTPAAKKQGDPEGKILSAEFTDGTGKAVKNAKTGDVVSIKIISQNMKGKNVKVRIWEEDFSKWSHDLLYEKTVQLIGATSFVNYITLTKEMYNKGYSFGEKELEYFIEVEHNNTSVTSAVIPVTLDAPQTIVPKGKSVYVVGEREVEKKVACICKEQYKDLVWGGKVSCEFRKKVVKIANRLGKDPNLLMAGIALETGRTFSPTAGKGTNFVGLIQFGLDAAQSVGTTLEELLKMKDIEQLDYVEKYLNKHKDRINTLTDFYLSILMPVDVGKGNQPNHVVFDNKYPLKYNKNGRLTDLSKSRHYGYRQNPAFLYEGKTHRDIKIKRDNGKVIFFKELSNEKKVWYDNGEKKYEGDGKTYIWEIEKSISTFYEEGKQNKTKVYECQKDNPISPALPKAETGTWNVIITEHYTGSECKHTEKTPIRNNCRRGKIEVYDSKEKVVLTISDCLLEGIKGEDRMLTDADAPFGTYQINSSPFIMGSTSGSKRTAYGPNPRLVFEPIPRNGDEASKSGRSAIRIHGGRQETKTFKPRPHPSLLRTQGCIRIWDGDAKRFYDWWAEYSQLNPNVKPGKLKIIK